MNRVLTRASIALQRERGTVIVMTLIVVAALIFLFHSTVKLPSIASGPNCADRVAALVAGDLSDIPAAKVCFAPATRYAQMTDAQFDQFVHQASPNAAHEVRHVGTIAGTDSTAQIGNYQVASYVAIDGFPESTLTLWLDSAGKVIYVQ